MRLLLALAALLAAAPLHALCNLTLSVSGRTIAWSQQAGAVSYDVAESADDFRTARHYTLQRAPSLAFEITRRATAPTKLSYVVTAQLDSAILSLDADKCSARTEVIIPADEELRRMTRKAIIPVAGSVTGANGARFKTTLRMTATHGAQRGRVVFHPSGRPARDDDPSIAYSFLGTRHTIAFDDVVAATGATGLGTIDIVPDADALQTIPIVLSRSYTEVAGGSFGSYDPVLLPIDFLAPSAMSVEIPPAGARVNLGLRTLTATTVSALIYDASGRLRDLKSLSYPADTFVLAPAAQLLGATLSPGDSISLSFTGSAIPFYTLTDNGTNDPAVIVPQPQRTASSDVGAYVID